MLAIIGGTGFYQMGGVEVTEERELDTPFGKPSDRITFAKYGKNEIVFLPRHGKNHNLLPHEVNYRANIWALKSVGVKQIIGISAVGSLQKECVPGELAIPSQYVDLIKGPRNKTFFGDGLVAHISTAEPTCANLTKAIKAIADSKSIALNTDKTYVCVDGPRLGTKAESNFLRNAIKADLVGMTNVPEVFLAREAQICYATIGVITDYDCWMEDPKEYVTLESVMELYGKSIGKVKELLCELLKGELPEINESYRQALKHAVLTPESALNDNKKELLKTLLK